MLERIHDRMPLVLHPRHYTAWLDPETAEPAALMQPFDNGNLEALSRLDVCERSEE
jgi:putative SOS response-associated peptidase YedK